MQNNANLETSPEILTLDGRTLRQFKPNLCVQTPGPSTGEPGPNKNWVLVKECHSKDLQKKIGFLSDGNSHSNPSTRFRSSPLIIRVPSFLPFGFNEGTQREKGQKGTTQKPSQQEPRKATPDDARDLTPNPRPQILKQISPRALNSETPSPVSPRV